MSDAWGAPRTREHTFATGRTATLREALPVSELIRGGLWDDAASAAFNQYISDEGLSDRAAAVHLWDVIVMGMFVDPRIVPDDQVAADQRCFPITVLEDTEIDETVKVALGGATAVASFLGDDADAASGAGSGDVPGAPVDSAGTRSGKSGGARRRPASGGSAARKSSAA